MKTAVMLLAIAAAAYFGWKQYEAKRAAEPPPSAQPGQNAPVANQHGENRATAFSGAAPE
jgi:hypothetical protein